MNNFSTKQQSPHALTIDYDRNDKNKYGYGVQSTQSDPYKSIDAYGLGAGASKDPGDRTGRKIVQPPGKKSMII